MVFDMHELTKNYDTEGKESQVYIDYICAVIELYLATCLGSNQRNMQRVQDKCGLNQEHILMIVAPDQISHSDHKDLGLVIHEQFKQVYMKVCKIFYV